MSPFAFRQLHRQLLGWLRSSRQSKKRRVTWPHRMRLTLEALEDRTLLSGVWTQLTNAAPGGIGTMMLLPDGSVMAQNGGNAAWYRLTPDASGSYVNGTWTQLASMNDSRLYYASDVLQDGRVFVAGGEYGSGRNKAEIYDPVADTWTQLPNPPIGGIVDSISETLPDGRVLVGSISSRQTAIYDPSANTWTVGPTKLNGVSSDEESWAKLPDQSILTVDFGGGGKSERYIPSLNQWVNDTTVPDTLYDAKGEIGAGMLLPDGRVFFLGATGHTALYTPSGTNAPGAWTAGPDIPNGQGTDDAPAAMMVNGVVLCAVSPAGTYNGPTTFYEFDPTTNSFAQVNNAPSVSGPAFASRMLDLPDGSVLLTTGGSRLYEYTPDGSPLAAGQPTIASIAPNDDGSFQLTGTLLNGISEGAAYGDDAQMASNYPLVRLTDVNGNVFYARTYNWSSTDVMTGSTPETTDFVLPLSLAPGQYALSVVVNGIASNAVDFFVPAGTIDYSNGFTAAAGLVLNGSAQLNGSNLELTDGGTHEASSAFALTQVPVTAFNTQFTFQLSAGSNTADGFTFTIQGNSPTALGPAGGALGYGAYQPDGSDGIPNSIAIKFDLYNNAGEGVDSTGLYTNGALPTTPAVDLTGSGIDLHSGDVFQVGLNYDGSNLTETITDLNTGAVFQQQYTNVDIPSLVGGNTAYVGFTGGTGGLAAVQNIQNWSYGPATTPTGPAVATPAAASGGSTSAGTPTNSGPSASASPGDSSVDDSALPWLAVFLSTQSRASSNVISSATETAGLSDAFWASFARRQMTEGGAPHLRDALWEALATERTSLNDVLAVAR